MIVTLMLLSLLVLALLVSQGSLTASRVMNDEMASARALWGAEAGVGLTLAALQSSGGAPPEGEYRLADGTLVHVSVSQAPGDDWLKIVSRGTAGAGSPSPVTRGVEVFVQARAHPLFFKATYVGNAHGLPDYALRLGPDAVALGGGTWTEGTWRPRIYPVLEADLQVDFDGDGSTNDVFTLEQLAGLPGWSGHVASGTPGNGHPFDMRLDLNRDGDYSDTVRTPPLLLPAPPSDPLGLPLPPDPLELALDWETAPLTPDGDYINGDVYVNGDLRITGSTNVVGAVDAVGQVLGDVLAGVVTPEARPIAPPDLRAMDYDALADVVVQVGGPLPAYVRAEQSASYYDLEGDGLGAPSGHTNAHFHLGADDANGLPGFGGALDGGLILVKGNLWLHGTGSTVLDLPVGSTQVTIVVEGNLYIADDLQYNNALDLNGDGDVSDVLDRVSESVVGLDLDGDGDRSDLVDGVAEAVARGNNAVLFIVKAGGASLESYVDLNRNYQRDPDEPIVNDDGDGVYEGPVEGQGNVVFGDPRFGTGGVTDGYVYAENDVYLVNPPRTADAPSGQDAVFGVKGFLSAGGIMDLGVRVAGEDYNNFRVSYDARLEAGKVRFKGVPNALGGGLEGLTVAAWREVP